MWEGLHAWPCDFPQILPVVGLLQPGLLRSCPRCTLFLLEAVWVGNKWASGAKGWSLCRNGRDSGPVVSPALLSGLGAFIEYAS